MTSELFDKIVSVNIENVCGLDNVYVAVKVLNNTLTIKFIRDLTEAIQCTPNMHTLHKDEKLTIKYSSHDDEDEWHKEERELLEAKNGMA